MVAILRAGGLGDVLLTLPAVHALRARSPVLGTGLGGTRLEAAGYPAFWRAVGPLIDRILSIDDARFAALYGDVPDPVAMEWLHSHNLLVAWTARPLGAWIGDMVPAVIQASPYPPPGLHAAVWLCETIGAGMPERAPDGAWLDLAPAERVWGQAALARLGLERPTVLHPGAGAAWKRWPAASFARLAAALTERGHRVALVEGPADAGAVQEVLAQVRGLPVIRQPDLRDLARLLSQARLFVGNDSGVTHLAAMAGTPTIALFGPTDPASWAPLGDIRILRRCRRRARRQGAIRVCDDPACMAAIAVEDVLDVIDIGC